MLAFTRAAAGRSLSRLLAGALPRRSYAAAALADCYESEEDDEEERSLRRRGVAAVAAWGEEERRGVQWVFMGNPAAQKRVYAARVAELLDVPYISMGTLVRQELHPRSTLYKKIANAVNEGKLVTEDIIFGLLSKRMEEGYQNGENGFILDGIPRTKIQAEILDQIADIDLVVNFKCMEDCLVKKHFGGDICPHCGKFSDASTSQSTGLKPCLENQMRHSRLNASVVTDVDKNRIEKLRICEEQGKLLEEHYRKQKKLLDFQLAGGPGETWQGLLAALHLQHINVVTVVSSSNKLTV